MRRSKNAASIRSAELKLQIVAGDFVVVLRDDGQGFPPGEVRGTGNGLRNLVARAEALGGRAVIVSAVGQGTKITLVLPLPHATPVEP